MEIAAFEEKALGLRPDLVIIEYVSNDLHLPNFIRTRNDVLALDRSYLVDLVERRLRRGREPELFERLARLGLEPGLAIDEKRVPAQYRDMVGFGSYVDAMRKLRDLSLEHGFSVFTITLSPSPGRSPLSPPFSKGGNRRPNGARFGPEKSPASRTAAEDSWRGQNGTLTDPRSRLWPRPSPVSASADPELLERADPRRLLGELG
jgi:hypothetical protein